MNPNSEFEEYFRKAQFINLVSVKINLKNLIVIFGNALH